MAVVVQERPRGRSRWREAFPKASRRLAGEAIHGGMKNDPGEFTEPEPRVEAFESLEFVDDRVRHPELPMGRVDVEGVGHELAHSLLRNATCEAAQRLRIGPGC